MTASFPDGNKAMIKPPSYEKQSTVDDISCTLSIRGPVSLFRAPAGRMTGLPRYAMDRRTAGTRDRIARLAGHRLAADRRGVRLPRPGFARLASGRPVGRDLRRQGLVRHLPRQPQSSASRGRAPHLAAALA